MFLMMIANKMFELIYNPAIFWLYNLYICYNLLVLVMARILSQHKQSRLRVLGQLENVVLNSLNVTQ